MTLLLGYSRKSKFGQGKKFLSGGRQGLLNTKIVSLGRLAKIQILASKRSHNVYYVMLSYSSTTLLHSNI